MPGLLDRVNALGELARARQGPVAVDQQQRLGGRGRALPFGGAGESGGRVQAAQQLVLTVAFLGRVDRAAEAVAVGRRAAGLKVQLAACRQHRVADLLGVQTARIEAPEVLVGRIRLRRPGGHAAVCGLPVGGGEQNLALQALQAPAAGEETLRQVVEQLRMRRRLAEPAEIVRGLDEAAAEQVVPDAVGDHARGQRVVLPGQPGRQDAAPAGGVRQGADRRRLGLQQGRETGRDVGFALAGLELVRRRDRHGVGDDEGVGQRGGLEVVELLQRLRQLQVARLLRRILDRLHRVEALALVGHLAFAEVAELPVLGRALLGLLVHHGPDVLLEALVGALDAALDHRLGDGVHLRAQVPGGGLPDGVLLGEARLLGVGRQLEVVAPAHRREEGAQAVVVLLQDRVELVVVAAGAAHAQPHEHLAGIVGHVGEDDLVLAARVALVVLVDRIAQVRRGHQHLRILRIDLVAGELLAHELVVRLVGVQALDDVVAVGPGVRPQCVLVVAVALGVAHQVEPVLRPALAVARTGQQGVHQLLVGLRIGILDEGLGLLAGRRQAVQVEVQPANQLAPVRLRRRRQAQLGVLLGDEAVDVVAHPAALDLRRTGIAQRLEAPVLAVFLGETKGVHRHALRLVLRPGGADPHPLFQHGDLLVRQLLLGRHRQVFVVVAHGLDDQRLVRLAGHQCRPRVAAGGEVAEVVDTQSALLLLFAVALVAALHQQGADLVFKELQCGPLGVGGRGQGSRRQTGKQEQKGGAKNGSHHKKRQLGSTAPRPSVMHESRPRRFWTRNDRRAGRPGAVKSRRPDPARAPRGTAGCARCRR